MLPGSYESVDSCWKGPLGQGMFLLRCLTVTVIDSDVLRRMFIVEL